MFDFEKLTVYQRAKKFNLEILDISRGKRLDYHIENQLKRASLSIMLNIAEGTGRFTKRDKRQFYVISRGSVFECASILDFIRSAGNLNNDVYSKLYSQLEELSKMLRSVILRCSEQKVLVPNS